MCKLNIISHRCPNNIENCLINFYSIIVALGTHPNVLLYLAKVKNVMPIQAFDKYKRNKKE